MNDFCVTPTSASEALRMFGHRKVPCMLFYMRRDCIDNSTALPLKSAPVLKDEKAFHDLCSERPLNNANLMRHIKPTFECLSPTNESPGRGRGRRGGGGGGGRAHCFAMIVAARAKPPGVVAAGPRERAAPLPMRWTAGAWGCVRVLSSRMGSPPVRERAERAERAEGGERGERAPPSTARSLQGIEWEGWEGWENGPHIKS